MSVFQILLHSHWDEQASTEQSAWTILEVLKRNANTKYFEGFHNRMIFFCGQFLFFYQYRNLKKKKASWTCSDFWCSQKVRIKTTSKSEKERVTGMKAIQHKGLWRSLTFLYVRIESHYMVFPGTLTILDRSIRVLTIVCISSNNSPERQVKYFQSNQPFVEGTLKHTFQ